MTTVTTITLLEGLKDAQNDAAWRRFTRQYRPMVVKFAAKLGLNDTEAEDAAQETMAAFVRGYCSGAYDRSKGRLRTWLLGIAFHKIKNARRAAGRETVLTDRSDATGFLASLEASNEIEKFWEEEWQRAVVDDCLEEVARTVDSKTYDAFNRYVLQGQPAQDVAKQLGVTRNAVYISKNRVISKVRELRQQIEEHW